MSARLTGAIAVAATLASVEGASLTSPAAAHAYPLHTDAANELTCPTGDVVEVQYLRDPHDSNAYYVCAIAAAPQRLRCPSEFLLNIMRAPPACYPRTVHFPV
jgi:hypothetical protein